jgi:predicted nucleotide-binding protein
VVHGRDDGLKNQLARLLDRLSLEPVILSEQADSGRTIFEKLQQEFRDVGYAFVLLTPDDVGTLAADPRNLQSRARQNVVFEHGWLVGYLGPSRVCAIVKSNLELPSDLHGIVYKYILQGQDLNTIALDLLRELRVAGYEVDANALLNAGAEPL